MAETEKITINMSVVDLGRTDILVEQGFYSNRTDLIRTAIRNQLNTHAKEIEETVTRKAIVVGVLFYNNGDLKKVIAKNQQLDIRVAGLLLLDQDIEPDIAVQAIKSISVFGVFRANKMIKKVLADKLRSEA